MVIFNNDGYVLWQKYQKIVRQKQGFYPATEWAALRPEMKRRWTYLAKEFEARR